MAVELFSNLKELKNVTGLEGEQKGPIYSHTQYRMCFASPAASEINTQPYNVQPKLLAKVGGLLWLAAQKRVEHPNKDLVKNGSGDRSVYQVSMF